MWPRLFYIWLGREFWLCPLSLQQALLLSACFLSPVGAASHFGCPLLEAHNQWILQAGPVPFLGDGVRNRVSDALIALGMLSHNTLSYGATQVPGTHSSVCNNMHPRDTKQKSTMTDSCILICYSRASPLPPRHGGFPLGEPGFISYSPRFNSPLPAV